MRCGFGSVKTTDGGGKVTVLVFVLLAAAGIIAFLPRQTVSITANALQEKREFITSRKLSVHERFTVRVRSAVKNAGVSMRGYLFLTLLACGAGMVIGMSLFNSMEMGMACGLSFLALPYIYMLMRGQTALRREMEQLENAMNVMTNAYIGSNDIVDAFFSYVHERNRNRDPGQIETTPFDEFVTEVTLINPDVERALYILETKIKNYHFCEWVKMLRMCNGNSNLKFALQPIVKAMGDAKAMQVESDTQMSQVWKDYIMTVALMFAIIPIMRFTNSDWYAILTATVVGKVLIGLMLGMALVSAFIVTRITKPISTNLGRVKKG
jgi:Flp pilus assembly protein TadB